MASPRFPWLAPEHQDLNGTVRVAAPGDNQVCTFVEQGLPSQSNQAIAASGDLFASIDVA
jgi:hypothetical protein